jgi:hypothetical protein
MSFAEYTHAPGNLHNGNARTSERELADDDKMRCIDSLESYCCIARMDKADPIQEKSASALK